MADSTLSIGQGDGAGHGQRPPISFEAKLSGWGGRIVKLISKRYYISRHYMVTMSARETAELVLLAGRLVQADGYEGELSPAQWMGSAFLPAPTRSPGPRRHSRSFRRPPVAPHRKPSMRLRRVAIWSGSDPRLMD